MPRLRRFNQLKRPNVRQSWNKANLYNLSRITTPPADRKTFFQQKWTAKSMLRAYHNPDVREGTWTRMFDRRLPAVVPMDHRYLAQHDGSEMAEGRGMGLEKMPDLEQRTEDRGRRKGRSDIQKTPYMHMTFFPLERRLDTAIFRAMFASSTRQARQFVVHGWVKVNGKKMIYPGYQLNPGDLFSVDPERVMYATGAPKVTAKTTGEEAAEDAEENVGENAEAEEESAESKSDEATEVSSVAVPDSPAARADAKSALKKLLLDTKTVLGESKEDLSGKRIRELRDFNRNVKKLMSQYRGVEESSLDESIEQMRTSFAEILGKVPEGVAVPTEDKKQAAIEAEETRKAKRDAAVLAEALERVRENPYDPSKPYATPWRPRDFMSAFAFIPRYLEVNQNICSAVYLRHPVARPGLAEVPTPYSAETMALAFNWYLRRR